MKKTNNKGFAITALLYGLSIMGFMIIVLTMSIMQNTRRETTELTKVISNDLSSYGQTSSSGYLNGTTSFTVPENQSGIYKVELFSGEESGDYTSGVIYLKEKEKINFTGGNGTGSSLELYDGPTPKTLMLASKGTSSNVVGLAKKNNSETYLDSRFFINPRIIENVVSTASQGKFSIQKVDQLFPETSQFVNGIVSLSTSATTVTATSATKLSVVYATVNAGEDLRTYQHFNQISGTPLVSVPINSIITDIYVEYGNDTTCGDVNVGSITISSCATNVSRKNSKSIEYHMLDPLNEGNNKLLDGNYYIQLISGDNKRFLSTPSNEVNDSNMLPFGISSDAPNDDTQYGRLIQQATFAASRTQKWRFEKIPEVEKTSNIFNENGNQTGSYKYKVEEHYKVEEIDEYRPFELNKTAGDTSFGEEKGPILICGRYTKKDGEYIADNIRSSGNINEAWVVEPIGKNQFIFKSLITKNNETTTYREDRYLTCNDSKCYLTKTSNEASAFYIFNAIM